jgi:hypothetical protein
LEELFCYELISIINEYIISNPFPPKENQIPELRVETIEKPALDNIEFGLTLMKVCQQVLS